MAIYINKLAAAKRQIQAAIRFYFMREDDLAIHVVASAAYGLLKDLKRARGKSEAADQFRTTIFYVVRDYKRGCLPKEFLDEPELIAWIASLSDRLPEISVDSAYEDFEAAIPEDEERMYWNEANRFANFLKHADRDSGMAISVEDMDNRLLLMKCVAAYRDIAPDELGNEGTVFAAFVSASSEGYVSKGVSFDSIVSAIRQIPQGNQLAICLRLIEDLNSDGANAPDAP